MRPLEPAPAQGGSGDGKLRSPPHTVRPRHAPGGTDIESQERVNHIPEAARSILKPKLPSRESSFPQNTGRQEKRGDGIKPRCVPSRPSDTSSPFEAEFQGKTRVSETGPRVAQGWSRQQLPSVTLSDWGHPLTCCFSAPQSIPLFGTPWTAAHRPPCPSPSPRVCSHSCPSGQWCHPAVRLSLLFFGTLHSDECIFPFLLCLLLISPIHSSYSVNIY